MRPEILWHGLPLLCEVLLLIIVGKFVIWSLVVMLFGYSPWIALACAAGLCQIGELSFVVARAGRSAGLIGENVFIVTLAASLISIFINVFLLRLVLGKVRGRLPAESSVVISPAIALPAPVPAA